MEDVQIIVEKVKADIQDGKSDEEIYQSLSPFFGKDLQWDGRVVEQLAIIPDEKIVRIFHRILEAADGKKLRKMIKRSLYRLKGKGIAVKDIPLDRGRSILHPLQVELPKGYGSSIDFLGHRLLLLALPYTGRGWMVMEGLTSDTEGLIDFSGNEMTRKGFREFFEGIQGERQFPMVEMEPSYVGFLFTQSYQLTLEKKRTPPQGYLHLKKEIESIKKEYAKPLIYSYLKPDEIVGNDRILMRAGDLLKADLFSSWLIEKEQIQPYADIVWEADESKIVLTKIQKEARFQEIYQRAMSELFPEERRFIYQRRLEEMAYLLLKMKREDEAITSLSAAINLEKPMNPIQPNPFLLQLVIKSIFALLKEAYDQKTKEPSLIVKP